MYLALQPAPSEFTAAALWSIKAAAYFQSLRAVGPHS
jgi:hypothetical protein